MKKVFLTKNRAKRAILVFVLGFFLLATLPVAYSAEEAQSSAEAQTLADTKTSSKAPSRSLPVQDVFESSSAKVEAVADNLEYQKSSGKMIARGNAVITYQGTKILADYAEVETDAKKAYAKGHVLIFQADVPRFQGEEIFYDFGNHSGSFPNARAVNGMFYAKGEDVHQIRKGVSRIQRGSVTTCNREKPHYEIRCRKATLYEDEKIIMHGATIHVLGVPVFWLPWLDIPLNIPSPPFTVTAGHTSQYGYYVGLSKGVTINKHLWGRAHVDWRSERGFGAGWDQYYKFGKYAYGSIKTYLTQDKEAPTPGYTDPGSGDYNPYAKREDRERGRITWRHRTDITDNTHVILRYHRVADEYFLQDFFEDEYRNEMEQHSFVTGTHNTERYGAMIHLEKKMNSFESLVERMPQARLDWKNQPFYKELVYNESRVQFDNLAKRYSRNTTSYQKTIRTDAYSRWYMPLKWKEINFAPFAGYRGTGYSQQESSKDGTFRSVAEYGMDLRTHAYRTFDVSFDKLGVEVNQLRHVFEPSIRFQGTDSTVSDDKLTHFDTVDKIDDAAEVIFGLDNRLQTKRVVNGKTQRVDIVSLNTYVYFDISSRDSTVDGAQLRSLANELTLRPYEWLLFQTRFEYDFSKEFLKLANNDLVLRRGHWKLVFGHRYAHQYFDWYEERTIEESQQFVFDARYQINKLWEVGGYIRWDTSTNGVQEYQVSAARDLHDYILEFGYNMRDSWIDDTNSELFFNFRMKAFPGVAVAAGGGRASFSEPRIGETVAGANEGAGRFGTATMTGESPLLSAQ